MHVGQVIKLTDTIHYLGKGFRKGAKFTIVEVVEYDLRYGTAIGATKVRNAKGEVLDIKDIQGGYWCFFTPSILDEYEVVSDAKQESSN